MICAMSNGAATVLPPDEFAQFKAEFIHRPDMPYCRTCDCCHEYDGRPPYCDTRKRFFVWQKARREGKAA